MITFIYFAIYLGTIMAQKGYLGDDLLWAGLGIGAVIAIWKLSKPLSDTVQGVGGAVSTIANQATGLTGAVTGEASNIVTKTGGLLTGVEDFISKIGGALTNGVESITVGQLPTPVTSQATSNIKYLQAGDLASLNIGQMNLPASPQVPNIIYPLQPATQKALDLTLGGNLNLSSTTPAVNPVSQLNNAQLANSLIAQATNVSHATSNITPSSAPLVVPTVNAHTGQIVNLVRSSVLAPVSSNGKRYKV
jgi:hypothetical protein